MRTSVLLVTVLATAGCYHATIDTGLAPNGTTVEEAWAASWLGGLVPPKVVETAAKCPHGVAKVETQLSFLNQAARVVTLGIYTPMTITVQCASPRAGSDQAVLAPESEAAARIQLTSALAQGPTAVYIHVQ